MTAPRWRVWTYAAPAIVLGCSQRALQASAQQRLAGRCELLERESGGGAVLAGPWLVSASVVLPSGHSWLAGGLLPSYQALGELHAQALQSFGITARAVPPDEVKSGRHGRDAVDWACFGSLSPWEVVDAQGRKLVGLAQRRRQTGVLLVAGTLVTPPDWPLLCTVMGRPQDAASLHQKTVSCAELVGHPVMPERFAEALMPLLEHSLA